MPVGPVSSGEKSSPVILLCVVGLKADAMFHQTVYDYKTSSLLIKPCLCVFSYKRGWGLSDVVYLQGIFGLLISLGLVEGDGEKTEKLKEFGRRCQLVLIRLHFNAPIVHFTGQSLCC